MVHTSPLALDDAERTVTYLRARTDSAKVAMMRTDCAVMQDNFTDALKAAAALPRDADLPLASRARYMADLALMDLRLDQDENALAVLLTMSHTARLAPGSLPAWAIVAEFAERHRRVPDPSGI